MNAPFTPETDFLQHVFDAKFPTPVCDEEPLAFYDEISGRGIVVSPCVRNLPNKERMLRCVRDERLELLMKEPCFLQPVQSEYEVRLAKEPSFLRAVEEPPRETSHRTPMDRLFPV
jgi:hypothetical protein